jgi:hypothetical protein
MNLENLIKVRDIIDNTPGLLNMNSWGRQTECGTTLCIAGIATVQVAGDTPVWATNPYDRCWALDSVVDSNGTEHRIPERAREVLGLTFDQGDRLFYASDADARRRLNTYIYLAQRKAESQ